MSKEQYKYLKELKIKLVKSKYKNPLKGQVRMPADIKFIKLIQKASKAVHRTLLDFIILGDYDKKTKKLRYWSMFEEADGGEYFFGKAF